MKNSKSKIKKRQKKKKFSNKNLIKKPYVNKK